MSGFSFRTLDSVSGATIYTMAFLLHKLHFIPQSLLESLCKLRPVRSSWTEFSTTVPMRVRCSSTMEALRSPSSRVSGAFGWTEITDGIGGIGAPPSFEGGCLSDSRAVQVSEIVCGKGRIEYGPHRQSPWGFAPPYVRRPRFHPLAPP